MDGDVVQVIPVGRSLDKEGISQVCLCGSVGHVGPTVVSYAVTSGASCVFLV